MLYMLDTNAMSDLVRNPSGKVAGHVRRVGEDAICTSIVVAAELRYGAAKKASAKLSRRVEDLLSDVAVLPFDLPADAEYGSIRAELEAAGHPIGGNDLLIAAHARALDTILVTANMREFQRVRGLSVENWLE
ncbi:type II toxin-antitoxin system VapC family toxin (plasmid) [Azospirillum oryzae]|uniref:Ribonuclease VapC n=1 Tax=Azospirillum oryzae TaxID=286727 RepID=A0A6N1AP17_9PROT|nr:type II toxin-antitoxin system VapC family toxin [Azospirillum oryzae]KAA0585095.1 type II toxin-antitoxin system VapC family toxin [Azospirillum oryzae]QKS53461.1 type II toxin-antitoxin system VapC family toxin [Azospirillum oryzae]GLR80894.1 ribonuclease VapC [Azospirillum oryzae]